MCAQRLSGTATSRVSALLRNGRAALLSPLAGRHCPTVARGGGSLRPFSPPAFLDPGSRQEPSSAHIRLSACAGLPAPWLNHKTPEGGFRTRGLARELLSIQAALGRLPLCSFARPCARSDAVEIASIFQKIVFILLLFDFDYLPPLSPFDFDSLPFIFEIAYYIIFKQ